MVSETGVERPGRMKEGAVAQLGERLPCTQEVRSSILLGSTNLSAREQTRRNMKVSSRLVSDQKLFNKQAE